LRATGTTNASTGRKPGLTGRKAWAQLEASYERHRDTEGLLPATVEIVFGQAWAPGARRRRRAPGDEIAIALDNVGRRPPGDA
jgi:malonyl-CoA O-methyltransferase